MYIIQIGHEIGSDSKRLVDALEYFCMTYISYFISVIVTLKQGECQQNYIHITAVVNKFLRINASKLNELFF